MQTLVAVYYLATDAIVIWTKRHYYFLIFRDMMAVRGLVHSWLTDGRAE